MFSLKSTTSFILALGGIAAFKFGNNFPIEEESVQVVDSFTSGKNSIHVRKHFIDCYNNSKKENVITEFIIYKPAPFKYLTAERLIEIFEKEFCEKIYNVNNFKNIYKIICDNAELIKMTEANFIMFLTNALHNTSHFNLDLSIRKENNSDFNISRGLLQITSFGSYNEFAVFTKNEKYIKNPNELNRCTKDTILDEMKWFVNKFNSEDCSEESFISVVEKLNSEDARLISQYIRLNACLYNHDVLKQRYCARYIVFKTLKEHMFGYKKCEMYRIINI